MEGQIVVLSRFDSVISRTKVNGVNLNGKIYELKLAVCKTINFPSADTELLYGGVKLKDNEVASAYNIKPGVTIHAVKKAPPIDSAPPEKLSRGEMKNVARTLQNALINPAYRNTVEKILANPDTLDNLIATTPSLDKDPVAIAMLQDPDLLAVLADPKLIEKVISKHPGLAQAAMFVTSALREHSMQGTSPASRRRTGTSGHYSLDRLSDDEDDMDTNQSQPITANQLATALAAAASHPMPSTSGGGEVRHSGAATSNNPQADLRQVLRQALGGPPQPQALTESGLQQLREMGITDENVARQALTAAGGDIQGALEIIFGEGL